jgi:hypothetical protein
MASLLSYVETLTLIPVSLVNAATTSSGIYSDQIYRLRTLLEL